MEDDTIESLSFKLCTVLEDIGVTEELISFNRYVCTLRDVFNISIWNDTHIFMNTFGSQREGSTTLGMHSDVDTLFSLDGLAEYTDVTNRPPSKAPFLAIKTKMSCPQCYSLELVIPRSGNTSLPANEDVFEISMKEINSICRDLLMSDEEGRLLLSNHFELFWFQNMHELKPNDKIEQHGPAYTYNDKKDYVYGIHCSKMPDDCHVLFSRPKPGHWPRQVTTRRAKQCGVFFIKPGNIGHTVSYNAERKTVIMNVHYQNKFASSQWRVSTNMIELLLMCDLDIVQMKAYILAKMIRKQFLKPIVGDELSTFHVKTAFLFTVEKYPMEMQNAENLVNCVLFCLKTLRRFLQRRYCPHYIIASVNLFDGKLKCSQYQPLIQELTEIINSGLQCVYTLKTDSLGERLKSFRSTSTIGMSREIYWSSAIAHLLNYFRGPFNGYLHAMSGMKLSTQTFRTQIKHFVQNLELSIPHSYDFSFELEFIYHNLINIAATLEASDHINEKEPITDDIHDMYKRSFRSGQISNYLKNASMLVCIHDYDRAVTLLNDIESMITPDMVEISLIPHGNNLERVTERAQKRLTPNEVFKVLAAKIITNVEFTKFEINCAPSHLIYEMYNRFWADYVRTGYEQKWIELAVVNAKPFLYYLQYLAHKDNDGKYAAAVKLASYCISTVDNNFIGLPDTAYNLMGHILELGNEVSLAWDFYVMSAKVVPCNNAAYWHICRLLSQYVAERAPYEMTK